MLKGNLSSEPSTVVLNIREKDQKGERDAGKCSFEGYRP